MKILAINGSPRKEWNTATLLEKSLEGAASEGADVEIVHLYEINFKGCTSCFACKLKNGKDYGRCGYNDELTPILKKALEADAIILGSPIYFGTVTGEMKLFMERHMFPYLTYEASGLSLFPKKIPVGFIYTMGADENRMKDLYIDKHIELNDMILGRIFGYSESLIVSDTYQFDDYSKYVSSFDVEEKTKRHNEVFPLDCDKAYELGVRFAKETPNKKPG